jgi:hypothetical protein
MSFDDSAPVEASAEVEVRKSPDTLPLTEEALLARADRASAPRRLALSGRPHTTPAPPTFLRAKFQIGGATGPKDFGRTQVVFHKDDVPPHKLANVTDLLGWKNALSARCGVAERWNGSAQPQDVLCTKRTRVNLEHDRGHMYQYNFRAEVLPPQNLEYVASASKFAVAHVSPDAARLVATARAGSRLLSGHYKRAEEMPVNPKLAGSLGWRPESRATRQEQRALVAAESAAARAASARGMRNLTSVAGSGGAATGGFYKSPEQRHAEFVSQVRTLKSAGLTEGYLAVLEAKEGIPRHNRLAKEHSAKERVLSHSGTFAFSQAEDAWMWSDTGSFDRHGPGDVAKVRDPLALNLASPNAA